MRSQPDFLTGSYLCRLGRVLRGFDLPPSPTDFTFTVQNTPSPADGRMFRRESLSQAGFSASAFPSLTAADHAVQPGIIVPTGTLPAIEMARGTGRLLPSVACKGLRRTLDGKKARQPTRSLPVRVFVSCFIVAATWKGFGPAIKRNGRTLWRCLRRVVACSKKTDEQCEKLESSPAPCVWPCLGRRTCDGTDLPAEGGPAARGRSGTGRM